MLNLSRLQLAVDRRASRKAKEQALADALGAQGATGAGMRRGLKTYFTTNKGNVVMSHGRVRLTNKGPTLELPSLATMRKKVGEYTTERAQVRALVTLLAVAGVEKAAQPEVQTTSNDGLLIRAYLWKTSKGIVVLATGPRFEPQVKLVTGPGDFRVPTDVVVGFGSEVSATKKGKLLSRMGRSAQKAKRQAPARKPKPKPKAKPTPKPKRATRKPPVAKRTAPPKRTTPKKRAAPKPKAATVTPPPSLTAADLEMLSSLMDGILAGAE